MTIPTCFYVVTLPAATQTHVDTFIYCSKHASYIVITGNSIEYSFSRVCNPVLVQEGHNVPLRLLTGELRFLARVRLLVQYVDVALSQGRAAAVDVALSQALRWMVCSCALAHAK